ncbi:MAG: gliding motility-associated-like protein [Saprospiraceae bacterium]|jgi:gliding motility-associated-like protein
MLLSSVAWGQLVTNNSKSAITLVKDVLTGEGVEISNVTYIGSAKAIGEFFGASSNIGLDHGIIMSTGTVLNEVNSLGFQKGPIGPNNNPNAKTDFKLAGDADVELIVGKTTHDAAVLEFDFIPDGDTVKFRYVFASEEYPSQIASGANDFFAFFISGVGISGKENIALLPGTSTAVSIETVNAGVNASYYIANGNGLSGNELANGSVVNYNAFTTVLTAVSKVVPCQTYHLKIVITDVLDGIFDSGVFLDASSLNSVPIFEIDQQANFSPTGNDKELFENCSHNGELVITRENKLFQTLSIDYTVSGSAVNGVDYELLATNVTFAIGETSKTIEIKPLTDLTVEGIETVVLKFDNPDKCDVSVDSLTFTYQIMDRPTMSFVSGSVNGTCAGEDVQVSANVSGGVPGYTYKWLPSGTEISETVTVNLIVTSTFLYEATDLCGQTITGDVTVNMPLYTPLVAIPMNDTTIKCRGAQVAFIAGATGGAGDYTYKWSSGQSSKRVLNTILSDVTYDVEILDKCKEKVIDDVFVKLDYPAFSVLLRQDTVYCYGDTVRMSASAFGGVPPYVFAWESGISNPYSYVVLESKSLLFTAYDSCGIIPAADSVFITSQQPTASFAVNSFVPEPNESIKFLNDSRQATSYFWDFGNGLTSTERQPSTTYEKVDLYPITLYAFDDLNCSDTISHDLPLRHPLYYYLPSSFSPDEDGLNDLFLGKSIGVTEFSMIIFDRGGVEVFSTTDVSQGWNGNFKSGNPAPVGVYVVKVLAKSELRFDRKYKFAGTVTLVR